LHFISGDPRPQGSRATAIGSRASTRRSEWTTQRHDGLISQVRKWIIESAGRADDGALQPDTNLMDDEYLDSLGMMGLILFIEELRGMPIEENDMSVHNFVSLRHCHATCRKMHAEQLPCQSLTKYDR
jgi:acyl carrier protein